LALEELVGEAEEATGERVFASIPGAVHDAEHPSWWELASRDVC